jgi:serine/threonine protein kinase
MMAASDPQQFGEFAIIEKLGQGAMGAVYKARQTSLNRIVALKLLPAHYAGDADFLTRFKNEAMAAAALNHPHIVQVYAAGEDRGTHFFAMEYVEGESFGARMERKGRIDVKEVIAVACHVAQALEYAWRKARVIHRDIKPDNIFLSREGTVKLGDLGLAKLLGNQGAVTQTGAAMGTPYYVSPEQAMGTREIDFRADIYSLGCTIYHAISGEPPYRGESAMSVMLQHISQPPPKIHDLWPACPPPLIGLLDRMLRKRPEERHGSYAELLEQLFWVAERIDQPAIAEDAAHSLIVPMAVPRSASTPDASRKSSPAPATKATVPKAAPPARSGRKLPAFLGAITIAAIAVFAWQPWKKGATNGGTRSTVSQTPTDEGGEKAAGGNRSASENTEGKAAPTAAAMPLPSANASTPPVATLVPTPSPAPAPATPAPATPTPTPTPAPAPATPTPAPTAAMTFPPPEADGFLWLLRKEAIGAWKQVGFGGFNLQDGVATSWVAGNGEGCWWYSGRTFADFTLKLEFRIATPGSRSGVYVRCPNPGNDVNVPVYQAYQIGVSDDSSPLEATGAISGIQGPASVPQKAGDWNELEIQVEGRNHVIKLNGTLVNYFTGNKERQLPGYIGLQNYKLGGVQIRNIRIRELSSPEASAKPKSETEKWVAQMEAVYQPMYRREVTAPFEAGMAELRKSYIASLNRESAGASKAGKLKEAITFRDERQRFEAEGSVPDDGIFARASVMGSLRAAYRAQAARLEADHRKHTASVFGQYDKVLATSQTALTQRQRLDEALLLQQRRETLAKEWAVPAPAYSATGKQPFVNTLGMKFVPVQIQGGPTGGKAVLFSVWDTRVQDYAAYAAENPGVNAEWKDAEGKGEKQEQTHPVVNVSWTDAKAFCAWLTKKERAAGKLAATEEYRLPYDHEWSCAAGIGDREDPNAAPGAKDTKISGVYPWGSVWPPPFNGAGNYDAGLGVDGYKFTSPVGSFPANRLGLFDMGGNVWQWCEDWYDSKQLGHALRGASWLNDVPDSLLSSNRFSGGPTYRSNSYGFRCVLAPATPASPR